MTGFHRYFFILSLFQQKNAPAGVRKPPGDDVRGQYEKLFNRYCPASLVFDFSGLNAVEFIVEFL